MMRMFPIHFYLPANSSHNRSRAQMSPFGSEQRVLRNFRPLVRRNYQIRIYTKSNHVHMMIIRTAIPSYLQKINGGGAAGALKWANIMLVSLEDNVDQPHKVMIISGNYNYPFVAAKKKCDNTKKRALPISTGDRSQ